METSLSDAPQRRSTGTSKPPSLPSRRYALMLFASAASRAIGPVAASWMMSSTTKSGTIGADGSLNAWSVLSASARFFGWSVRSGRSPRSGPPFTRTRCWTRSGCSFAHTVATHAPSEFPTSVTLPCGSSFIAPSKPARSVAKGRGPSAGALSPCPARSTATTAKLFARRGAIFAHPPAWSPAPCTRTTAPPPPPEKTHCGPTAEVWKCFSKPAAESRRRPSQARVASGLFQKIAPAAAPRRRRTATRARTIFAARGTVPRSLDHAEGGARHVVADAGRHEDDEVAGLDLPEGAGIVERHRDARRARVPPLVHHNVGLLHRQAEVLHDDLDRRLAHLRQEEHVDVADCKAAVGRHLPHELWPALIVELRRVTLDELDRRPAGLDGLDRGRLVRAAGEDRPVAVVRPVGPEAGRDEALLLRGLEHGHARPVPEEKDHRVVRVRELVHHVRPDSDDRLQGLVRRDEARRRREAGRERRARAADVERPGVFRAELVLDDDRRGGRDEVRRVGAEEDEIDVERRLPRRVERLPGRADGEVGRRPVGRRVPAGPDPAARLHLVDELRSGRVEARPQGVVRHLDLRHVRAGGDNPGRAVHVPSTRPPSTESVAPWTNEAASDANQK